MQVWPYLTLPNNISQVGNIPSQVINQYRVPSDEQWAEHLPCTLLAKVQSPASHLTFNATLPAPVKVYFYFIFQISVHAREIPESGEGTWPCMVWV